VQRVGGDRLGPQGWNSVEDLTELATDLDPLYFVVYESVTTLMTVTAKRGMSADRIALKGLAAMPGAWPRAAARRGRRALRRRLVGSGAARRRRLRRARSARWRGRRSRNAP
jgi:hypothetical protein